MTHRKSSAEVTKRRHQLNAQLTEDREALDQRQHIADLLEIHDLYHKLHSYGVHIVVLTLEDGKHYAIKDICADHQNPDFQAIEDIVIESCTPWQALRRADVSGQARMGTVVLDVTGDPGGLSRAQLEEQLLSVTSQRTDPTG